MEKAYKKMLEQMLKEFYQNGCGVLEKVYENEMTHAADTVLQAKKIYVLGIGHSGFFGRIFAMKLNHVGLRAYSEFDEINPPFGGGIFSSPYPNRAAQRPFWHSR